MNSTLKRLTRGLKFDESRFVSDAVKLQILPVIEPTFNGNDAKVKVITSKPQTPHLVKLEHEGADGLKELSLFTPSRCEKNTTEASKPVKSNGVKKKGKNNAENKKVTSEEIHLEKIRMIRKTNRIHIWGDDLADPMEIFDDVPNIDSRMLNNIRAMDYHSPTPIQMQAIPILLKGRELLASAPTGSGKTAAFLLPLIMQLLNKPKKVGFRAVLLAPTRELAKQIQRDCRRLSGGTGLLTFMITKTDVTSNRFKDLTNCDILVSTPNRLIHLLKQGGICLKNVEHLIVDECDHLFEIGFRDQLGFIYSACDNPNIKRAFFSATCAFEVEEFCKTHLNNPVILAIGAKNSAVDLIKQELSFTGTEFGKLLALRDLIEKGIEPPLLVFVQNQERCEELSSELTYLSVPCGTIHSGKTQKQRENVIDLFREGKIWVLICTALLSRGMDFPAVRMVINFDLPLSHIQYIHSIGRTGRAGRIGHAITFFTEDDKENLRRIAQVLENSGFPAPAYMLKLKKRRRDKNKKSFPVLDRQSLSRMSGYDYAKKKKMLQMVQHTVEKKSKENPEYKGKKIEKRLKLLEIKLQKEKKSRNLEKSASTKRKLVNKKRKPDEQSTKKQQIIRKNKKH